MHASRIFVVGTIFAAALFSAGCGPVYPNCETDKDCEKNEQKRKEFCVAGKCQMCRTAADCPTGQECAGGACKPIPGYCQNKSQCPAGQECIANRCGPCRSDKDCPAGAKCWKGMCDTRKHCTKDDECAQNEDCVDGICKTEVPVVKAGPCTLAAVYFDFNESGLTTDATSTLAKNSECLKKETRPVTLVGHADPRGTAEYNIALSEKRAQSVRSHLERLGTESSRMAILPRGALDAKGTDEPSWAQDRRVDFNWR
jgi:peptidoglycan-associated lipoprotein